MKRISKLLLLVLTTSIVASCITVPEQQSQVASNNKVILIVNADIVTMNPDQPSADAMAISGDRIVAIGSEAEVRAEVRAYDKFYDLQGLTVTPGFIETPCGSIISAATCRPSSPPATRPGPS